MSRFVGEPSRQAVDRALAHLQTRVSGSASIVLCGSSITPYGDAFSMFDFLVLRPGSRTGAPPRPVRAGGVRYRYFSRPFEGFARELAEHDDAALYLLRHGRVVHDPDGRAAGLWSAARSVDPGVWRSKTDASYREFRRRRASLAWTLRRGQLLLALDNVTQLLERALAICCYLEGEPPPARKWLLQAALRTPVGREVRPHALDLVEALGALPVLGGSYGPRHNRLYAAAGALQAVLEHGGARVPPAARDAAVHRGTA